MTVNTAGYVPILDGGNPRIVGGNAREYISGGQFVFASGATGVVSSGANSFATSDITYAASASGLAFNGLCVQAASSGTEVAVATRGSFLVRCAGTVVAGQKVKTNGTDAVLPLGSTKLSLVGGEEVGRALTAGASGGYAVVDISA